jgi:hypothetical protein
MSANHPRGNSSGQNYNPHVYRNHYPPANYRPSPIPYQIPYAPQPIHPYGHVNYVYPQQTRAPPMDPWLVSFLGGIHNQSQLQSQFEWTKENVKIRLQAVEETIKQLQAGVSPELQSELESRLEKDLAVFYTPNKSYHSIGFHQFLLKVHKQQRKLAWRKKKRVQWKTKKPQVMAQREELTRVVDEWFETNTAKLHKDIEDRKIKKLQLQQLRKERKSKTQLRKLLSVMIPLLAIRKAKSGNPFPDTDESTLLTNDPPDSLHPDVLDPDSGVQELIQPPKEIETSANLVSDAEVFNVPQTTEDKEAKSIRSKGFYGIGNSSIAGLVQIRRDWDRFIVPSGINQTASRVPQHWVEPPFPSANWLPFVNFVVKSK